MTNRTSMSLWSTTAIAAAMIAVPAHAQDQVVPPNPNATAQQSPADPQPNADAPQSPEAAAGTSDNAIVVTGLRRALQSARNIKRNSDQVVDAVVAEDIGKLPDITVSDTAARIPGVQVERSGGEASRVLLRGLDNTYYTTTYNGRELFTAETRSVALQDFPAGAIAAIEAFKTSTANLVEPGLAGLVNVRSRRPFDFKGLQLSGSIWAMRPNQSRDASLNGNLLISDRWQMGEAEVGALVNFSYTRLHYQDSVRRNGFWIADLNGGRSPDFPEIHYNEGDRWRPSVNAALQYRKGDLELYAEGLWQGYRARQLDSMWAQPLWAGGSYDNFEYRGGSNAVVSGTVHNPGIGCCGVDSLAWGFKGATHRETNTYQFAVGGSYDAGPLRISADVAHTTSHFALRTESVDYQLATKNYDVNFYNGEPGGYGPVFEVVGLDFSDPANYQYRGFFEDYSDPRGSDWQGRLDFEYDPQIALIPKIQAGIRYVDRAASDHAGSQYWNARYLNPAVPISAVPLDYEMLHPAFRGDSHPPSPISWLAPTYGSVWSDLTAFRQYNIGLLGYGSADGPPDDPTRTFRITEQSIAGYAQANLRFELGAATVDGIIGVRVVNTKDHILGTTFTSPVSVPYDDERSQTDWLPNANLNVRFSPEWVLRLAATKTRTRPTFSQLNPGVALGGIPGCAPTQPGCFRGATSGNPNLKNFESDNYDASLEYYFSRTGFASATVFRRDLKNFIANRATTADDPSSDYTISLTQPVNLGRGHIQGFEAQVRTFFDWDGAPAFVRSFGVEANVTYIDSKVEYSLLCGPDNPDCTIRPILSPNAVTRSLGIPGVSDWTWNVVGMYERGPLSLRVAYNRRTGYPEGDLSERDNFFTLQGRAHPSPRLDLSASYTVNDNITFFADWTNIFPHPFRSDIERINYPGGVPSTPEVFPMVVQFEETVLSGGVRFNFGGQPHAAPVPVYVPAPPPPPVAEQPAPPPVVEQPAPPPAPVERGERG
jgi:TonB-dependent receptor